MLLKSLTVVICFIYQLSSCCEPAESLLKQSQDEELFILRSPSLLRLSLFCWRPGADTRGVCFSTQVSGLTWINSASDGGDIGSNHGSGDSSGFFIHRNDISTQGDDVSTLWLLYLPTDHSSDLCCDPQWQQHIYNLREYILWYQSIIIYFIIWYKIS